MYGLKCSTGFLFNFLMKTTAGSGIIVSFLQTFFNFDTC